MSQRDANAVDAQQPLLLNARLLVSAAARLNSLLIRRYLGAEDGDGDITAEIANLHALLNGLQDHLNDRHAAAAGHAIALPPTAWSDDKGPTPADQPAEEQTALVLHDLDPDPDAAPSVADALPAFLRAAAPPIAEPPVMEPPAAAPPPPVAEPFATAPRVSEPITCPICGAHPRPSARFCTTCGYRLPEPPPEPPPSPAPVAEAVPAEQPNIPHIAHFATASPAPPAILTYCTECGLGVTTGVTRCPNCDSPIELQ